MGQSTWGVQSLVTRGKDPTAAMPSGKPTKKQVRKAFYKADKDGNGKLTMEEFKACVLSLLDDPKERQGMKKKDFEMLMSMIDDGDNLITLEEFFILFECDQEGNEKKMLVNMIKAADKNKDGFISAKEMEELGNKMGGQMFKNEKERAFFMMMVDLDGDMKISINELTRFFTDGPKEKDPKEDAKMMFRMADVDGDGYITKKEIIKALKMIDIVTDEEDETLKMFINQMLAEADTDKDGKLNYREFCSIVNKM